jgi:hypothetical protein
MSQNEANEHLLAGLSNMESKELYEEAITDFLLAIKASKPEPFLDAEIMLSRVYFMIDLTERRNIHQLQRVIELNPGDAASLLLLGVVARIAAHEIGEKAVHGQIDYKEIKEYEEYKLLGEKAFRQAKEKFPAYLENPNFWSLFYLGYNAPLIAGDYFVSGENFSEAMYWYSIAENYDIKALSALRKVESLFGGTDIGLAESTLENTVRMAVRKKESIRVDFEEEQVKLEKEQRKKRLKRIANLVMAIVVLLVVLFGCYWLVNWI